MTKRLDHTDPEVIKAAAELRVQRGARWLTENFPGWQDRIDPDTLNLASAEMCICGQVFKTEGRALEAEGEWDPTGYTYAHKNLFSEANSWISAVVKLRARGQGSPLKHDEEMERRVRVSIALGFDEGSLDVRGVDPLDKVPLQYSDIEDAWRDYLNV